MTPILDVRELEDLVAAIDDRCQSYDDFEAICYPVTANDLAVHHKVSAQLPDQHSIRARFEIMAWPLGIAS